MELQALVNDLQPKTAAVAPLNSTLKLDFGNEHIFIDGHNQNAITTDNKAADCTLILSKSDFIALSKGELEPMAALMTDRIKLEGNAGVIMQLQSLLK